MPTRAHKRSPFYRSFLLRFWNEADQEAASPAGWRFSLEATQSGERHGFGSLEKVVSFIRQEMAGDEGGGNSAPAAGGDPCEADKTG